MSNQVFETVRTVLAVREYQDKELPHDVVDRIVEAGHLSASSRNLQTWHFVVVRDRQALRDLGGLVRTGPYIAGSAAAIVVAYERESRFGVSDASRAIQGMILTAWGDGVGYIPSTYADNDRSATASACTPAHLRPGRSGMEGKAVERPIDRSLRPVSRQAGKLQLVCRHRPHDGAVVHVVIRPEQLLRVNGGAKPARHDPTKCALKGGCVAGVHEHRLAEHGQIATTRPVFIGLADRLR